MKTERMANLTLSMNLTAFRAVHDIRQYTAERLTPEQTLFFDRSTEPKMIYQMKPKNGLGSTVIIRGAQNMPWAYMDKE